MNLARLSVFATFAFVTGILPVSAEDAAPSTYPQYVKAQADTLVGVTGYLARKIREGDLESAQTAYSSAHKYFARIEPAARLVHLDQAMDARADAYEGREADPRFSGFHRLEHGLFAQRSTTGLAHAAARLDKDAHELRDRVGRLDASSSVLMHEAARLARDVTDRKLSGEEERYAHTELWDVEANLEAVQQIIALVPTPPGDTREADVRTRSAAQFARVGSQLEAFKEGCGFKSYEDLSGAEKADLRAAMSALADVLAPRPGPAAMN